MTQQAELRIDVTQPADDAKVCQLTLNRKVSPVGTVLFETTGDAEGWPMIQALFEVKGVHSVIAKESVIILSREDGVPWSEILDSARAVLEDHAAAAPALGAAKEEKVWIRDGKDLTPSSEPAVTTGATKAADADVPPEVTEKIRRDVETLLANEINPYVASHGGVISLLDVRGTRIFIHMGGGCQGCGQATATLKHGVETAIRTKIPEVTEILDTTDHAAGTNPYFASTGF